MTTILSGAQRETRSFDSRADVARPQNGDHVSGLQIWDAAEPRAYSAWIAQWQAWPQREVFAHPAYLNLFKTDTDRVLCAYYESRSGRALYPFLLRDLTVQPFWSASDGPATDLAVPFSYGGPVAWDVTARQELAAEFWKRFDEWAATVGLVSEFARLLLFDDALIDSGHPREFRQQNVVRSLELDEHDLWMDLRPRIRNRVRRAQTKGVRVEVDMFGERLDDFLRIYWGTMDRRKADAGYYLDRAFFERLRDDLQGQVMFFHAFYDNQVVASELILVSADTIYYFLGGTNAEYFKTRANDLVKHEIMLWAKNAKKRRYVLGGGVQPNDGIFQYKLSLAPSGAVDFWVRKRILCSDRYRLFTERHARLKRARNEPISDPEFFPAYRA